MAHPKPRPETPRPMRLTERDKLVLQTIYDFEGLMSRQQLAVTCFGGNVEWAKKRARLLYENGLINQPTAEEMYRIPKGKFVYWLDTLGLEIGAGLTCDQPRYTYRVKAGSPQRTKLDHDLSINDVRLAIIAAVAAKPAPTLGQR